MFETARPFLIALAIGLLIGIERERAHAGQKIPDPLGSRSFTLLAMLGAVAAHVASPAVAALLTAFAGGIILAGYFRTPLGETATNVGATTEVAAMATFVLGYLAHDEPWLSVMLAVITLVILALKPRIHAFARAGLTEQEISAALTFLVIAFVVLPLLPDAPVDPWGLLNPFRLWLLFVLIAGINVFGYLAVRMLGPERGSEAAGFFAGFVSSTAATLSLAQRAREEKAPLRSLAVGVVLANVASATAQIAVVAASNPALIRAAGPVLGSPIAAGAILVAIAARAPGRRPEPALPLESPLALRPTAILALVLAVVLVVASAAGRFFGTAGVIATALVVGSTDVHAVTLAVATLAGAGSLAPDAAILAILVAFLANMTVKLVLAGWGGGRRFLLTVSPPLVGMMTAAVAAYVLISLIG